MKKKSYIEALFLLVLGALSSVSLAPYNFFFINFITFTLFFIFIFNKKRLDENKKTFLYGWYFGFGYFLSNLYWITFSLTFDKNFEFLIPVALILIPAFLGIFYGIATYCFFLINIKKPVSNLLLFSLIFGFFEFIRGNILSGFPWNLIAYSFSNNLEIIQITSLIGTYAFNILCISFFASPAILILKENKKELIVCIFFLLLPIVLFFSGSTKIRLFHSLDLIKNDYVIRAVGSEIELDRFYGNTDSFSVVKELIELSEPVSNSKTLFIWPEGIIPNMNQTELKKFEYIFNQKFNEKHLIGLGITNFKKNENKDEYYNSFSFYDHKLNLINSYNKVKLVPFGEFVPFEEILGKVGLKSLTNNYQSFSSGKNRNIISIIENDLSIKILPLICYEIIYSGQMFKDLNFDYIINISEDGWFGNTIGPHQHFTHSIFRAIESGKYLIRSANNGITAVINPVGIVEKKIEIGNSGYLDLDEKRVTNKTLFSQYGNKMFLIIILLYIFLIFSFNRIL